MVEIKDRFTSWRFMAFSCVDIEKIKKKSQESPRKTTGNIISSNTELKLFFRI